MFKQQTPIQAWTRRLIAIAILTLIGCGIATSTASAADSVIVESKIVRPGDQNVEIRIRVVNSFEIFNFFVPLEVRKIRGDAYFTDLKLDFDDRLAGLAPLEKHRDLGFYPVPLLSPPCPYKDTEMIDADTTVSVDGDSIAIQYGCPTTSCSPSDSGMIAGADVTGSLVLTVNLDTLVGEIRIDESCLAVGGGPLFADNGGGTEVPVVVPGVISVLNPPETLWVDDVSGSDTNPGTESQPFQTIQAAMNAVDRFAEKTTILVRSGGYNESIVFEDSANVDLISLEGPFNTRIIGNSVDPAVTIDSYFGSDREYLVDGFTIRDNICSSCNAAGVYVTEDTYGEIYNCIIRDNEAGPGGAGGISFRGIGVIAGNWIVDNESLGNSAGSAGGIYVGPAGDCDIVNNTVARNTCPSDGSGIYIAELGVIPPLGKANPSAVSPSGVVSGFANNIIADNGPNFGVFSEPLAEVAPARHSVIVGNVGGSTGPNTVIDSSTCVFADPLFVDTTTGSEDYHLTCQSPAIQLGDGSAVPPYLVYDIDMDDRFGFGTGVLVDAGGDQFIDSSKTADFELVDYADTVGCPPHTVAFHSLSECVDETFIWDYGDGQVDSGYGPAFAEPEHIYNDPGVYFVTLIVANPISADTFTTSDSIRVLDVPIPTMSASDPSCVPTTVDFSVTLSSPADSVRWVFGDGDSLTVSGPLTGHDTSHVYTDTGHVLVTVRSYSLCGVFEDTTTIVVEDLLDVTVSSTYDTIPDTLRPVCSPLEVTFETASTESLFTYVWHFGDGDSSTVAIPTHEYVEGGDYLVSVIVTSACGVDTFTYDDTIQVVSDAQLVTQPIASPGTGCPGDTIQFTVEFFPSPDSVLWVFDDGDSSTLMTPTHVYDSVGKFVPMLTVWDGCGVETFDLFFPQDTIIMGTRPNASFASSADSLTETACAPLLVRFWSDVDGDVVGYSWDFGDGGSSNLANPVHTYLSPGDYDVRLIANGPCGSDTVTFISHVTLLGGAEFTSGPSASIQDVCVNGDSIDFTVAVSPAVDDSATWLFGDGESATGLSVTYQYAIAGVYTPQFIYRHDCGVDTLTLAGDNDSIVVQGLPNTAFSYTPDSGYAPLTVQFTDETPNNPGNWLWMFGDDGTSSASAPSHTYAECGEYQPALTVSNECGSILSTPLTDRIRVGDFDMSSQIIGTVGDSRVYRVDVDECVFYNNTISLSAQFEPAPVRGSLVFDFDDAQSVPPFTTDMTAIPIGGLSAGEYTITITATDQQRGVARTSTHLLDFEGVTLIEYTPTAMALAPIDTGLCIRDTLCIRNSAQPRGTDSVLTILGVTSDNAAFQVMGATSVSLSPGDSAKWEVVFCPAELGTDSATITIDSDDPVTRKATLVVTGSGIPEQSPPYVMSAAPDSLQETTIDDVLTVVISEAIQSPDPIEDAVSVRSVPGDVAIPGTVSFGGPDTLIFTPDGFLPIDDTISVTVDADRVVDLAGNTLDGDEDGEEEGAPDDNFTFVFYTGPGVYPGDTDNDGVVNETDVLPLGRFYRESGPARENPQPGFTLQPAEAWPQSRAMTYADANGDGVIDSMDICPIADYFDQSVELPKSVVEQWLNESGTSGDEIIRALIAALEHCPGEGQGNSILKTFLEGSLQSPATVPKSFELAQNYPNPFNPVTVIEYALSEPATVTLRVYDVQGHLIRVLRDQEQETGRYHVIWDGRDENGNFVASGVYFYRLETPAFSQARKMVLLK